MSGKSDALVPVDSVDAVHAADAVNAADAVKPVFTNRFGDKFIPFLSVKDAIPDVYIPRPLTGEYKASFLAKLPLVQEIERTYRSIIVPVGSQTRSWCRLGMGHKRMTYWMHGFLYTISYDSLMHLSQDPQMIETVCDRVKEFILLCSGHASIKQRHKWDEPLMSWDLQTSRLPQSFQDNELDIAICVISSKRHAVRKTYIVPFDVNSSPGSTRLLEQVFVIPTLLFGPDFANRARQLLTSRVGASHVEWNMLPLNAYLSGLFDDGYLALRPVALTSCREGAEDKHTVHFSIHWMFETYIDPNDYVVWPTESNLNVILEPCGEFKAQRAGFCETNATTGRAILDGQVFSVTHDSYKHAENMYIMLAFRWAASLALCLAGGVGMWYVDAETDSDTEHERHGGYDQERARQRKNDFRYRD